MLKLLLRRLALLAITLVGASFVVFASLYLAPGDPLAALTKGRTLSPEALAELRSQYGLDDPFLLRYWHWLTDVLHGDFGTSIVANQQVSDLLASRASTTLFLVCYAAVLLLVAGIALGVVSALRPGKVDTAIVLATSIGMATPSFVAAIGLISLFAVNLGWFPVFGAGEGFSDRLWHLTLPAIALATAGVAWIARVTRTAVAVELEHEHVETARARGIPPWLVVRRHVLRNAMIPISTVAGVLIASLFVGTVVVEQAFALNGLGSFLVQSVNDKDFAVVQAITLILAAAFMIANTVTELLYAWLDPRVKAGGAR